VISGASSGLREVRREFFDFTVIGFPHRDDSPRVAARRPNDDDDPLKQLSGADVARLAVVLSIVGSGQVRPVENLLRLAEIEASLAQGLLPLGAVEGDSHGIYCSYVY
jgi:hypothetical protein